MDDRRCRGAQADALLAPIDEARAMGVEAVPAALVPVEVRRAVADALAPCRPHLAAAVLAGEIDAERVMIVQEAMVRIGDLVAAELIDGLEIALVGEARRLPVEELADSAAELLHLVATGADIPRSAPENVTPPAVTAEPAVAAALVALLGRRDPRPVGVPATAELRPSPLSPSSLRSTGPSRPRLGAHCRGPPGPPLRQRRQARVRLASSASSTRRVRPTSDRRAAPVTTSRSGGPLGPPD